MNDSNAQGGNNLISGAIIDRLIGVGMAVELNGQLAFWTIEIHHKESAPDVGVLVADNVLPEKTMSIQIPFPQVLP
jgi:hypothetical protein